MSSDVCLTWRSHQQQVINNVSHRLVGSKAIEILLGWLILMLDHIHKGWLIKIVKISLRQKSLIWENICYINPIRCKVFNTDYIFETKNVHICEKNTYTNFKVTRKFQVSFCVLFWWIEGFGCAIIAQRVEIVFQPLHTAYLI